MRNYSFEIQINETAKSPASQVFVCTFSAQSKDAAENFAKAIYEDWGRLISVVPPLTPYEMTDVREV